MSGRLARAMQRGHTVAVRVIAPPNPTGVYLFVHGGGLVFGSSDGQDPTLERVVQRTGMACSRSGSDPLFRRLSTIPLSWGGAQKR
jgi:hypothetical protein